MYVILCIPDAFEKVNYGDKKGLLDDNHFPSLFISTICFIGKTGQKKARPLETPTSPSV